jgi:hypothetical protein
MIFASFAVVVFSIGVASLIYFSIRRMNSSTHVPRDSFDGPFAPHATSSLSMMNELYRQHRLAHSHQRDQQVLAELKTRFENDASFPHVGYKCKFGRITLSGRAQTADEKAKAEKLASSIFGVIDVSNQIVVVAVQKAG